METVINSLVYTAPPVNRKEILRYLNAECETEELKTLIDETLKEVESVLSYKVCYGEFAVTASGNSIDFKVCRATSADLAKNLCKAKKAVIFAATIGVKFDILATRYAKMSPAKALVLQAIGNERIESLCDTFNRDITAKYTSTKPRFSPGYGDLDLKMQRDIFKVLDCSRRIGLTLNESLLMSPQKSVTAIIGIC